MNKKNRYLIIYFIFYIYKFFLIVEGDRHMIMLQN